MFLFLDTDRRDPVIQEFHKIYSFLVKEVSIDCHFFLKSGIFRKREQDCDLCSALLLVGNMQARPAMI